jgi:anaerobic ribonucleoside-triphosphate reductase activating protein
LTHSHEPHTLVEPEQLAEAIAAIPGVEGLTVSGGEPFEQASAVARLCQVVRQSGLSVMVFTGWTYQSISSSKDKAAKRLLAQVDIVVDGPFIQEMADPKLRWRGSSNQKVRFLTDHYGPEVLKSTDHTQLEARFDTGGPLQITGFADDADLGLLAHRLASEAGILLTSDANDTERISKKG